MNGTLYLVLHKDDAPYCDWQRFVPPRFVTPGKDTIGLRVTPEAAIERYRKIFGETVPTSSLFVLCLTFTEKGFAYFASDICDETHYFCPRLSKRTYNDTSEDWGVWHFVGDLPLHDPELLQFSWKMVQ